MNLVNRITSNTVLIANRFRRVERELRADHAKPLDTRARTGMLS